MAVTDAPHYQTTSCPLCGETFDRPAGFRDHLFYVHDLMDDEGTETTLAVEPEPELEPDPVPVATRMPAAAVAIAPYAPSRQRRAPRMLPAPRSALEQRHLWLVPALVLAIFVELLVSVGGLSVVAKDNGATRVATASDAPSGGSGSPAATPTVPTTAVPAPVHNADADQRFAEQFAPKASDFPAGWTELSSTALEAQGGSAASDDAFASCASTIEDPTASADSGVDIALAHEPSTAFGAAVVVADEATAAKGLSAVRAVTDCVVVGVEQELKASLPRGVTFTHGKFNPLGWSSSADETLAESMNITLVGPAGQVPMRVDVIGARKGRALFFVFVIVGGTEPTAAQEKAVLAAVTGRMEPTTI